MKGSSNRIWLYKIGLIIIFTIVHFANASAQWVQVPDAGQQRITCFLADGANRFIGCPNNGVLLSTDDGINWRSLNAGLKDSAVRALFVDGSNICVGTFQNGIYFSPDLGATWQQCGGEINFERLDGFAKIGTTIIASTSYGGIFRSTDGGASWAQTVFGGNGLGGSILAVCGGYLYATNAGVERSSDTGATWTQISNGLPPEQVRNFVTNGKYLFAGFLEGMYRLKDGDTTWTAINNGIDPVPTFSIAAKDSNIFVTSDTAGVFWSSNNGTTWRWITPGLRDKYAAPLGVMGDYLYANDGSVYRRSISALVDGSGVAQSASVQQTIAIYPNPSNRSSNIDFRTDGGHAEVTIVNLLGVEVARLFDGSLPAGEHTITWDSHGVPPGTYVCRVHSGVVEEHVPVVLRR